MKTVDASCGYLAVSHSEFDRILEALIDVEDLPEEVLYEAWDKFIVIRNPQILIEKGIINV